MPVLLFQNRIKEGIILCMPSTFSEIVINLIQAGLRVVFDYYFLWLPIFLLNAFWYHWKKYVVLEADLKEEKVVLQIKLPREISKSPKAMELFLQSLHQTGGEGNFYDKYWKGGTRPWFSLELVSINGEIRFYIWTRRKFAKLVETQLYSQYPNAEVVETPDYTKNVNYDPEKKKMFGSMFTLTKDDIFPIKTYIDFGLGDDPKEEFKVDPIASVLEFLGTLKEGEQVWIQILIRAHKKYEEKGFWSELFKKIKKLFEFNQKKNWEELGKEKISELRIKDAPEDEIEIEKLMIRKSKVQESVLEALERSLSKPAFDTAIRAIYIADVDKFDSANIGGLLGTFKQYSSDSGLNGFKPKSPTKFDYPWQDPTGYRLAKKKAKLFNKYLKRANFETRHNLDDFILTSEELATIFHLPSSVVETPTLPRIPSKKSEPPTNIPL